VARSCQASIVGPACRRLGSSARAPQLTSFASNIPGHGEGASLAAIKADRSREILRPKEGLRTTAPGGFWVLTSHELLYSSIGNRMRIRPPVTSRTQKLVVLRPASGRRISGDAVGLTCRRLGSSARAPQLTSFASNIPGHGEGASLPAIKADRSREILRPPQDDSP
jgi:hypothetical protein